MSQNTSHAVMAQRKEEWRAIPSFPVYEASSFGRIKRGLLVRKTPPGAGGYLQLNLSVGGTIYHRSVHVLVCEAFHGLKPKWADLCAHNDGDILNNCEWNVRWATYAQNSADMVDHGTRLSGENHPRATVTREQVDEMRRQYAESMGAVYVKRGTRQRLAEKFGVTISVVKDVIGGRSW